MSDDFTYGQTHDVVKITFYTAYANYADPFLDSISAGFVIGLVFVYVKFNLRCGELIKTNLGAVGKRNDLNGFMDVHTCDDFVCFA